MLRNLNAHFILLLYVFNEDFYYNSAILNRNLNTKLATFKAANNRYTKYIQQAYKDIIDSAKLEEFIPLNMLDPPRLLRSHLLDSYKVNNLASYFSFFIRDEDFELIIANINKYIKQYFKRHLNAS
jgi:hypothetical protein